MMAIILFSEARMFQEKRRTAWISISKACRSRSYFNFNKENININININGVQTMTCCGCRAYSFLLGILPIKSGLGFPSFNKFCTCCATLSKNSF